MKLERKRISNTKKLNMRETIRGK